jgi:branched-chain amino acid transport system permease protein
VSAVSAPSGRDAAARRPTSIERGTLIRAAVIVALLLLALLAAPQLFGSDWIFTFTSVAIYSVAALGFGLLYGRVGMISLGQVALLSIGCWVGARLSYATSLPFPILLLAVGGITGVIGVLVGLPALRLSGLYLALITLMFAGATTVVLGQIDFPNGGHGFTGRSANPELSTHTNPVRRPDIAGSDTAYYRYVIIVAAIMFLLALVHVATKPGRAWASIRESEPAALSAGVNITLYKLWAFGLASFMTGIAGCLLAAEIGVPRAITFQTQDSLTLAATALIGGIFSLWGAIIAGVFNQLLPFLFQAQWSVNANFLLVVFGAGLLQVLLTAPGGLIDQFPKDMVNLGRLIARKVPVTRQAALGIGSILALIAGIILLVTVTPIVGLVVVILSPILAVYSQD